MDKYHKIVTVLKRDPETNMKKVILGQFATPEFEYLADNKWRFTEKVDGTNIRVGWTGDKVIFNGKGDNAQIPSLLLNHLNELFLPQVETFKEKFGDSPACLYGEGYGAKIQKGGGNYRSDQGFVLFDVRVNNWWLREPDVSDVAATFGLDVVPFVGEGSLHQMIDMVSGGQKSAWGDFTAEGLVARPSQQLFTRKGDRIITKLKHKDL
jgi:hypothetical protein